MDRYFLLRKGGKIPFQVPETWSVLNNVVLTPTKPWFAPGGVLERAIPPHRRSTPGKSHKGHG